MAVTQHLLDTVPEATEAELKRLNSPQLVNGPKVTKPTKRSPMKAPLRTSIGAMAVLLMASAPAALLFTSV